MEEFTEAHQGHHEDGNKGRDLRTVLVHERLQQVLEKEIGVQVLDLQTVMPITNYRPIATL